MKYIGVFFSLIFLIIVMVFQVNKTSEPEIVNQISDDFSNEQKVSILGYDGDAMEPYISRDENYLFFNNYKGQADKNLFWAKRVDDLTFEFMGEIKNSNTDFVDANPTMDAHNNFYFITTRDLKSGDFSTIYSGKFENGSLAELKKIKGTINIEKKIWLNMGVEITEDGNEMFVSNAKFKLGSEAPTQGDIRYAIKQNDEFNIPNNEETLLKNINTADAIEYAGEISNDGLELFYSQVTLSEPPLFKLLFAKRNNRNEPFGHPEYIQAPFLKDKHAFVEAPTLTSDAQRLYYHKMDDGKFSIFMLSRNE